MSRHGFDFGQHPAVAAREDSGTQNETAAAGQLGFAAKSHLATVAVSGCRSLKHPPAAEMGVRLGKNRQTASAGLIGLSKYSPTAAATLFSTSPNSLAGTLLQR